jgi:hypothetical protein
MGRRRDFMILNLGVGSSSAVGCHFLLARPIVFRFISEDRGGLGGSYRCGGGRETGSIESFRLPIPADRRGSRWKSVKRIRRVTVWARTRETGHAGIYCRLSGNPRWIVPDYLPPWKLYSP